MPNAAQLLDLLATRHAGDVFVPECKDHYTKHQRLDAWAIKKSWAHPLVWGYEIKVKRSDFLRDEKWRGYLPYCNEFYFVVPSGLIEKQELPTEAGLLVASRNLTRLYTKIKAPYRNVEIPESIYRYILFSRVVITRGFDMRENTKPFWERWLAGREDDRKLGFRVGEKLRKSIRTRIVAAEEENRRLTEQFEKYEEVRSLLKGLGFEADGYFSTYQVKNRIARLQEAVPAELLRTLGQAEEALAETRKALEAITEDKDEGRV